MKRLEDRHALDIGVLDAAVDPRGVEADLVVLLWAPRSRGGAGSTALLGPEAESDRFFDFVEALARSDAAPRFLVTERAWSGLERMDASRAALLDVEVDPLLASYLDVGVDRSNLRRLLDYIAVTYLGRQGDIELPIAIDDAEGLFHPEHDGVFASVADFEDWLGRRHPELVEAPRVLVLTVSHHFALRNRDAVELLLRKLAEKGVAACADLSAQRSNDGLERLKKFRPDVVLDTRHVTARDEDRNGLGVPFLQCATLMRMTISEWSDSTVSGRRIMGLSGAERAGSIEPRLFNGAHEIDGIEEFLGIEERIERIVARAKSWIRLRRLPNAEKRIALQTGLLAGGTPDNQLLHLPKSLVALFEALRGAGYDLGDAPTEPSALIADWKRRACEGEAEELQRLLREGLAHFVPVDDYRRWFETRVPKSLRDAVEERHGPMPGSWFVTRDVDGLEGFVLPALDYGKLTMIASGGLPPNHRDMKAIRRVMNEDERVVPSHNILAAAFYLEEDLRVDARLRFGSFSLDLLLPRRVVGLGPDDWPEILAGTTPDIRPYSIAATTFAIPARRRAGAVLVGHLTPPLEQWGLADEMLELQGDVQRWRELGEGSLRERFRAAITKTAREQGLLRELEIDLDPDEFVSPDEITALAAYLERLAGEQVSTQAHVLGQVPAIDRQATQLVIASGKRFLDSLAALPGFSDEANLRERARELADLIIRRGLDGREALELMGVTTAAEDLPKVVLDGCTNMRDLHLAYGKTDDEIRGILRALAGDFVPPGPAGSPERNPATLPTGRNLYFFDPEALPSKTSFELGVELADNFLDSWRKEHGGAWPDRVAFSLSTRGSMSDYGVAEAQILHLMGVRPVWRRGRVADLEVVPATELGRPRIDVFIETKHHYNDYLRSRAELLDRAVRLVCSLDEADNHVRENREQARRQLLADGLPTERAEVLSRARIFAVAEGRFGSGLHDGLFESTGVWESRADLAEVYMAQHDHVFTLGAWNEKAPEAYRRQLEGADAVLKTTSRHGAFTGRAHYSGGNLASTIEHLSGASPGYFLVDLRRVGDERIEEARSMMRREMRATIFDRRWIEAMKKESRSGAARMAALTGKALGWKINRPESVDDEVFEEIADIYLRDSKNLGLHQFFDTQGETAFQSITATLLEAARKEFWKADAATIAELAAAHAEAVAEHGELIDENEKLRAFVKGSLMARGSAKLDRIREDYEKALDPPSALLPDAGVPVETATIEAPAGAANAAPAPVVVQGTEIVEAPVSESSFSWLGWLIGGLAGILILIGAVTRGGAA